MDFSELLKALSLDDKKIIVNIINPTRKGEVFQTGEMVGYKPAWWGGGHYNWKKGYPQSFDSRRCHEIKKARIMVEYNCFVFGKKTITDWIDIDNCGFTIVSIMPDSKEQEQE
jgi:hypothetical protein